MDLKARKYEFMQLLFQVEKASIMDKLESIIKKEQLNQRDTLEEYNADIDAGISEIERGEYFTQAEVRKMASKW
ncbi:hypothetical protein [Aquimarina agarivorans]|uniref:hypothetical protein n=1 Tax=Aquimarina agarivorans TaxID=980584 RepID=UPI000248F5AB|nr:hypothetical protein [Aquimarina agarivorans]